MTYPGVENDDLAGAAAGSAPPRPVQQPAAAPASPYAVKAWGAKFLRHEFDIECPSGQRCRARQLQIEDAMSLGILDSLDVFTSAIMKDVEGEQKSDDATIMDGLRDPERRANFFGTVNRVIAHTVVIPKVVLLDDGNLPEGTIFANDIPFADKMHIFREVFTSRGDALTSFRSGQEGDVVSVEEESGVQMPTE